ncbi:hypothetical protein CC78DRAFT_574568 [Lojkania enalia]|uniref:Uncharacterized protein n=1 Tax=Lojkania enalia TaxID=147567 RepID=A0A9P4NAL5_9PLEO|nr:hypothetical protein CC78DRAFT_574568 [Didymosphaeria enalia]
MQPALSRIHRRPPQAPKKADRQTGSEPHPAAPSYGHGSLGHPDVRDEQLVGPGPGPTCASLTDFLYTQADAATWLLERDEPERSDSCPRRPVNLQCSATVVPKSKTTEAQRHVSVQGRYRRHRHLSRLGQGLSFQKPTVSVKRHMTGRLQVSARA